MMKFQIPILSILCVVSSIALADEVEDLYELPMSIYTPPKENLNAPIHGQIPKMKSGFETVVKSVKRPTYKGLEDITPQMVNAFKSDLVEKVLKRNEFEVALLGEKNLRSLPPLWVFGSEFSAGDAPDLLAQKMTRLAMSATNDDLLGIDAREKRRLISDLYLRAGHVMHLAAEKTDDLKIKQDHYLTAAQYFRWASVRMDFRDQKNEASQLVKREALLSVKYAKLGG